MKKYLLQTSQVYAEDIRTAPSDPHFRKATTNMILATIAVQKILEENPHINKSELVFILATHFGEVESTLDFLSTARETKIARPILFQNSLHNSTLGFASIYLGLKGPGLTISADRHTSSAVGFTTENYLQQNNFVLVCFVDYIPDPLANSYLKQHPYLKPHLNQAKAFLFSDQPLNENSKEMKTHLKDFSFIIEP